MEFGGQNPIKLSEYYTNASDGYTNGVAGLPGSGSTINVSSFRGKGPLAGLYPFTTFTFTNAGATGRNGPTLAQCRSAYASASWTQDAANLSMTTQGIQVWKVPTTGVYEIRAVGATGGNTNEPTAPVGNPADLRGRFNLARGQFICVLVGQSGWQGDNRPGWGGGGGTFVVKSDNTPLIVAGGCGSTHTGITASSAWQSATTGTSGAMGFSSGTPTWTAGYGATGGQGGDGAGFQGNGTMGNGSTNQPYQAGLTLEAPKSFTNGGVGGTLGGGFGGGGSVTNTWGGGGGGYSGGQGATTASPYTGGGGGSYNGGSSVVNALLNNEVTRMAHGFATITLVAVVPAYYTSSSGHMMYYTWKAMTAELKSLANMNTSTVIREYSGLMACWNIVHDKDLDSNVFYCMPETTRVLHRMTFAKGGTSVTTEVIMTYNRTIRSVLGACYAPACMGVPNGAFIIGGFDQSVIHVLEFDASKNVSFSYTVPYTSEVYGTEVIPMQASGFSQHFAVAYTRGSKQLSSFTVDLSNKTWGNRYDITYTGGTTGPSNGLGMLYYPIGKPIVTGDADTSTNRIALNDSSSPTLYVYTITQNGDALNFTWLKMVAMQPPNGGYPYHLSTAAYNSML